MVIASCGVGLFCGEGFSPFMALALWAAFALGCGVVLLAQAGAFALRLRGRRSAWQRGMALVCGAVGLAALVLAQRAWALHQHFAALGVTNDPNTTAETPPIAYDMAVALAPVGVWGAGLLVATVALVLVG